MIEQSKPRLALMPKHENPAMRAVTVVAWESLRHPHVFERYHAEPVGYSITLEGFVYAIIAAEVAQ